MWPDYYLVQGSGSERILEYSYTYDHQHINDEEHGCQVIFTLPPDFKPLLGRRYEIPNPSFSVDAWDWGFWVRRHRMLQPRGFVEFLEDGPTRVTAFINLEAIPDFRAQKATMYGEEWLWKRDSIYSRVYKGLPVDSLWLKAFPPEEEAVYKTLISAKCTFVPRPIASY